MTTTRPKSVSRVEKRDRKFGKQILPPNVIQTDESIIYLTDDDNNVQVERENREWHGRRSYGRDTTHGLANGATDSARLPKWRGGALLVQYYEISLRARARLLYGTTMTRGTCSRVISRSTIHNNYSDYLPFLRETLCAEFSDFFHITRGECTARLQQFCKVYSSKTVQTLLKYWNALTFDKKYLSKQYFKYFSKLKIKYPFKNTFSVKIIYFSIFNSHLLISIQCENLEKWDEHTT